MKKILDIPHVAQHHDSIPEEWYTRFCGIACLKMIMEYKGVKVDSLDLLNEGQIIGGYNSTIGWDHNSLVRLLRNHGISSYPQEFRSIKIDIESKDMTDSSEENNFLEKGIEKIRESIDNGNPVMVSVAAGFGENGSPHVVLVVGHDDDNLYFNDPNNEDGEIKKAHRMNKGRFLRYWRQFSIFID